VWYSNYAPLGASDFEQIAAGFAEHDLPLDTISVDMDWHTGGWYGYEWNRELFPDPAGFAAWLREENLNATFNIHPLYVPADDSRLEAFKRAAGHPGEMFGDEGDWDPLQANTLKIDIENPRHVQAYLALHRDAEDGGCDFWWIDGSVPQPDGRDECSWLNHVYRTHLARRPGHLPIVLARAGGLGGHRDPILFTGDACSQWDVLAFEVETSVRAAGGLLAYVSHDIGGFWHDGQDRPTNQPPDDLYLRWLQFGCLSPIFRLHSFNGVREPWRFAPDTLRVARRFMQLRMRLIPYLHQLVDVAHDTGLPPLRPTWFAFDADEAYECTGQYMLGNTLLVAPVVREDAKVRYWLPPGDWHHAFADRTCTGPDWVEETVPLDVMPLWLKDSASLELARPARNVKDVLAGPRETVRGPHWAPSPNP
jgi:alpha-glucosidase (family GH31 glycosyl hydrolase)